MNDAEPVSLAADLSEAQAAADIAKAVSSRHKLAHNYVMSVRRRHPEATPAEIVHLIERQYRSAITTAGAAMAVGAIAIDVGIALIPAAGAVGASTNLAKGAAKSAAKGAVKAAAKNVALHAGKASAKKAAGFLPAGDEQLQFEITAVFGLALAEIHGMKLDQDQAQALVYGLSNGKVTQQQIATMAADLANAQSSAVGVGRKIAAGQQDWSHWATTLADTLPQGNAQNLVRTMQTSQLDSVRTAMKGKHKKAVEYGVGAVAGGVTRFVFGREVIAASRVAFPAAPKMFPASLALKTEFDGRHGEPNRAITALGDAAKATGQGVAKGALGVGHGVAKGAAGVAHAGRAVSRVVRRKPGAGA